MEMISVLCFDCGCEFEIEADPVDPCCPNCSSEDLVEPETEKAAE